MVIELACIELVEMPVLRYPVDSADAGRADTQPHGPGVSTRRLCIIRRTFMDSMSISTQAPIPVQNLAILDNPGTQLCPGFFIRRVLERAIVAKRGPTLEAV